MPNPYHRIDDRMRYCEALCPQCQLGKVEIHGCGKYLFMKCWNCGHTFNPDERAFTKLRNHPDGTFVPGLKGRPKKFDNATAVKVAAHYRDTSDTIWKTAEKFGLSHATAARMIIRINGGSKQIPGRSRKYNDNLIREVALYRKNNADTIKQIAERFKLSYDTVRYIIRKQGIIKA